MAFSEEDESFTSGDLVRTFAVRAGAAIVVLAVVIGVSAAIIVEEVMRAESVRVSSIAADALLRHELTDVPVDRPLTGESKRSVDEVCSVDLKQNGIAAIRIWSAGRVLIYSSVPKDSVGSRIENDAVVRASVGQVVTRISRKPDDTTGTLITSAGPVVKVYAPLKDGAVVELYQSFTPIAAGIERTRNLAWLGVLALAVPAYVIELQIVRRAARKLDRQERALADSNERLARSLEDLEAHTLGTLTALASTVDAKDSYTARHALMVADYAQAIGRRMGLDPQDMEVLERACLLHDIGKIAVPESILLKPGKLDVEEFAIMKEHSARGAAIVASIPFLSPVADAVRHHHERYDGRGYPDGLAGEEISLLARIIAVADTFDSMTSDRPYRPARTLEDAREELASCAGGQLCPDASAAFLAALDEGELAVARRHTDSLIA